MHNNIRQLSKDRPPTWTRRYSHGVRIFLRYLDTKSNGEYLRKCIFEGPYTPTSVLIAAVEAAENIPPVAAHEEAETIHNMTTKNKLYFKLLFDVLKQFQNKVNDIHSERLARSANPLALLAPAQPYSDNYISAGGGAWATKTSKIECSHHTCNASSTRPEIRLTYSVSLAAATNLKVSDVQPSLLNRPNTYSIRSYILLHTIFIHGHQYISLKPWNILSAPE
ncbi:hypothetical protein Tco_0007883 [Tanacetum coccineum]